RYQTAPRPEITITFPYLNYCQLTLQVIQSFLNRGSI
ncbi:uncharacterized protein METZ01_LOCUS516223, partial [marine metagenome]